MRRAMWRRWALGLVCGMWLLWGGRAAEAAQKQKWWQHDITIGGVAGTWGGVPIAGLRGGIPLGQRLALRVGWSLFFDLKDKQLSYSHFSLDLLIRLPSPINAIRYYALTRLDFWPLWDAFGVNPKLRDISIRPTLGFSVLLGVEGFLIPGLALFLESGFSSGMMFGFAPIDQEYQTPGFVLQTGLQFYF